MNRKLPRGEELHRAQEPVKCIPKAGPPISPQVGTGGQGKGQGEIDGYWAWQEAIWDLLSSGAPGRIFQTRAGLAAKYRGAPGRLLARATTDRLLGKEVEVDALCADLLAGKRPLLAGRGEN